MASLSSSTPSIHRDVRSESRDYQRDKEHTSKWAFGARPSPGVKTLYSWKGNTVTGSKEQQVKTRPVKKSAYTHPHPKSGGLRHHTRTAQKQHAILEISSAEPSLSRSLSELLPTHTNISRNPTVESGVLYSFDAPSTPRKGVGLDRLVEKAEKEWRSKETDKIVRDEYEILDASGEVNIRTKAKGKRGSPKQQARQVVADDEEDEWERI